MTTKPRKLPGPDHPITIKPSTDHVVVTVAGKVVADTRNALTLQEADYPPAYYVPLTDVDRSLLAESATTTYCPYKGDARYYSIPDGGEKSVDAIWEYAAPYDAVAPIVNHIAFYPNRVDAITVTPG
jgi:uncharacterized protein (DUF427 family)